MKKGGKLNKIIKIERYRRIAVCIGEKRKEKKFKKIYLFFKICKV
jgi:hypothetical protein